MSLSDDPVEEIKVAKILLKELGLLKGVPTLVSCPTCGRIQYDLIPIAKEMEDFLKDIHLDITVAIMGCAVNGPGEARHADIGIAGGVGEGLLIKHGEIVKRVKQEDMVQTLKDEILKMVKGKKRVIHKLAFFTLDFLFYYIFCRSTFSLNQYNSLFL